MVYLHNPAQYKAPVEFINLVGGPHKFEKLMKCLESNGRSKMYITMFQAGFKSNAQKNLLIKQLQTSV